jgi:hypothetical protein
MAVAGVMAVADGTGNGAGDAASAVAIDALAIRSQELLAAKRPMPHPSIAHRWGALSPTTRGVDSC